MLMYYVFIIDILSEFISTVFIFSILSSNMINISRFNSYKEKLFGMCNNF